MRRHHEEAIRKLGDHFSKQEGYLAVIVGGSVAKGVASESADIDAILVVTGELYRELAERNALAHFSTRFCDYPGGYVDGKIVDIEYLRAAAERGNEPTRAAFVNAVLPYCADPEIEQLVKAIPVYPKNEQAAKARSFWAQFEAAHWYAGEALKRGDRYLLAQSVADMVMYGGRLVLAHNEVLYPYRKLFMSELARAADKPDRLLDLIEALLVDPGPDTLRAFHDAIAGFRQWNDPPEPWNVRFMVDTELAWLEGAPYVGDR
jgi:hypothetical protein